MRREDRKEIETLLQKKSTEKLIMAKFNDYTKECILYPGRLIDYNSWYTILFKKVFETENTNLKTVKILKTFFPKLERVFGYYTCIEGCYHNMERMLSGGWTVIDQPPPMFDSSCVFIVPVPKNFKFDWERETVIDDITVFG